MNIFDGWSAGEVWFYAGIVLMIIAVGLLIISVIFLALEKWKIKNKLEKDYGAENKK